MAKKAAEVNKSVSFCEMEMSHISEVMEIERESYASPWAEGAFLYEVLHNQVAHYIVALYDNRVIGYTGMWAVLDEGHITNIAVRPAWRNQNIGFRLMRELIRTAIRMGLTKMTLEVRPSNMPALSLYEKLGFKECGVRKKYYTDNNEDAIIMWKFRLGR